MSKRKTKTIKCKYCDNKTEIPYNVEVKHIFKQGVYTCLKCDIRLGRIKS